MFKLSIARFVAREIDDQSIADGISDETCFLRRRGVIEMFSSAAFLMMGSRFPRS